MARGPLGGPRPFVGDGLAIIEVTVRRDRRRKNTSDGHLIQAMADSHDNFHESDIRIDYPEGGGQWVDLQRVIKKGETYSIEHLESIRDYVDDNQGGEVKNIVVRGEPMSAAEFFKGMFSDSGGNR